MSGNTAAVAPLYGLAKYVVPFVKVPAIGAVIFNEEGCDAPNCHSQVFTDQLDGHSFLDADGHEIVVSVLEDSCEEERKRLKQHQHAFTDAMLEDLG